MSSNNQKRTSLIGVLRATLDSIDVHYRSRIFPKPAMAQTGLPFLDRSSNRKSSA